MTTKEKEEYVYVMSNESFSDDTLKVGWTRDHPNIRANDLHTSGLPTPFIVESVIVTNEGYKLEKRIHEHIKEYRLNSNREFFKISKNVLLEILKNELNLELKSIHDIIIPFNKKSSKCKKVDEIKKLYEVLNREAEEFFSNFNKEYTDLKVTEFNKKKHVSIVKCDYNYGSSLHSHGMEDDDERFIKNKCYFIKRDIKNYKGYLDDILDNYEIIKENIGIQQLRNDNKQLKEWILNTHKKMDNLKGEYIWELQ
jgi:hypothetical protein